MNKDEKIELMRAVLGFYADYTNYTDIDHSAAAAMRCPILRDFGRRAQNALRAADQLSEGQK